LPHGQARSSPRRRASRSASCCRSAELKLIQHQWYGAQQQALLRLQDEAGRFVGTLVLSTPDLPQSHAVRLARGDIEAWSTSARNCW
jgi:hypothetical protein